MSDDSPPFWRLDLGNLAVTGWLAILLAVASVIGGMLGMIAMLNAMGFPVRGEGGNRLLGAFAVVVGLGLGMLVFEVAKRAFKVIGAPIMRVEP